MNPAPLFHSETPRRAGRPRGARSAVIAQVRALGIHHFAFLRATLVGVDSRAAFARYLAWSETSTDLRHIESRRAELLKQILDAGRRLDMARAPDQRITAHLDALRASAAAPPVATLPTLDVWMAGEGLDPDAWSQADAIAEYKAAHGIDNLEAMDAADGLPDAARSRVAALNHLQTLLADAPAATDAIDTWFAHPVVIKLRNAGVVTLENLVAFINVHGFRWHDRIKGFGAQRALRVIAWLRSQVDALQLEIRSSVDAPSSAHALRRGTEPGRIVLAPRFGLVPLEQLALPPRVGGADGVFRSHMANTLEASSDLQAINAWLAQYDERPATSRSYRKEVERFVLWCTQVQGKAISSATSLDCRAFRLFLQAVPSTWIHSTPVARTDIAWRPFRGQPSEASQKQALVIVQTMFEGLRDAGYLVANPMRAVMKGFNLPKSKITVQRSFTEAEWTHVLRVLDELPVGPEQLRLRCVLELLVSSGIRLDELTRATWSDLRRETFPELPELEGVWILSVTGKRLKTRDVPIADDVVGLLQAHAAGFDRQEAAAVVAAAMGQPEPAGPITPPTRPLIRALGPSVPRWVRDSSGQVVTAAATEEGGGALSAAGIYGVIKRFFARAAQSAGAAGLDAARFERASTHWMRHTFVRQALVDGVPIEVASELVGHESIDTTSVYSSQELARKIKAVRGMRRRVA